MKVKLTEKFSLKRKGDVIDVSEVTANELIKEEKAILVGAKQPKSKEVKLEVSKEDPEADVNDVVIE